MADIDPRCRLLEVDFSGIEGLLTGWWRSDPVHLRLARLGLHAAVTARYVGKPVDLSLPDKALAAYLSQIKHDHPIEYGLGKRVDLGTGYGLTPFGMVEQFPEHFKTVVEAQRIQSFLFALLPGLRAWHHAIRKQAKDNGYLGGPGIHPFGYRHWFWDVLSYQPTDEVTARKWLRNPELHDRIVVLHGRYFKIKYGGDSKRAIAFLPQGTAAGVLKRAELRLFHPDSADYIGDAYFGRTPLLDPIHDSLFLIVPCVIFDRIFAIVTRVMQEAIPQLPCPPEWGIGPFLRIGVSAKASAPGGNWAPFLSEEDAAALSQVAGTIVRPNLLGMQDVAVTPIDLQEQVEYDAPVLPQEEGEMELWESLQRVVR